MPVRTTSKPSGRSYARDLGTPGQMGASGVPAQLSTERLQGFFSSETMCKKVLVCPIFPDNVRVSISLHAFQGPMVCHGAGFPLPPVNQFIIDGADRLQAQASKGFRLRPSGGSVWRRARIKAANRSRILLDTERRPPGQKQRSRRLKKRVWVHLLRAPDWLAVGNRQAESHPVVPGV